MHIIPIDYIFKINKLIRNIFPDSLTVQILYFYSHCYKLISYFISFFIVSLRS